MASLIDALTASGGAESPGFLNDLIKQLWPNMSVAIADIVKANVEGLFESMLPSILKQLKFVKMNLGPVPIHVSNVDVHQTENNGIKLDLDLDWDGKSDIELDGPGIPKIGIEHVKLRGRFSILLCPLMDRFPLAGAAQVAFVNVPHLDLDFTDAAHIANLGIIDRAVRRTILGIMSSMIVLPNRFLVKLDTANDYFKTYQHPLGVLRLTVESGENFGEEKGGKSFLKRLVHDVPDCFVKVKLSAEPEWRTQTITNHRHPEWNETRDMIVSDYDQIVETDVQDADTATGDDDIGVGTISVKNLLLQGGRHELALTHKDQPTEGKLTIRGEFHQFVPDAASFTSGEAGSDQIVGLMSVLIASVRNLSGPRQDLRPLVRVQWGDAPALQTGMKTDTPGFDVENPGFDQTFKIPIQAGMIPGPPVKILLINGAKPKAETEEDRERLLGSVEVSLDDVLGAPDLAVQKDFDAGNGATIRAGVWLRGMKLAE
ncbi:hypothetical protein B0T16DRAFT_415476 [Cercophora newfieldiana]|uniref:C2 domain-containing protein n=1 Tax=Cercophora newfieldiana TaxID=92897 RepID=A0AA40CLU6_9PEZI|nr:hypothetical protein B0T16DRAFT_415476 [Cercophora newfieldiana]